MSALPVVEDFDEFEDRVREFDFGPPVQTAGADAELVGSASPVCRSRPARSLAPRTPSDRPSHPRLPLSQARDSPPKLEPKLKGSSTCPPFVQQSPPLRKRTLWGPATQGHPRRRAAGPQSTGDQTSSVTLGRGRQGSWLPPNPVFAPVKPKAHRRGEDADRPAITSHGSDRQWTRRRRATEPNVPVSPRRGPSSAMPGRHRILGLALAWRLRPGRPRLSSKPSPRRLMSGTAQYTHLRRERTYPGYEQTTRLATDLRLSRGLIQRLSDWRADAWVRVGRAGVVVVVCVSCRWAVRCWGRG